MSNIKSVMSQLFLDVPRCMTVCFRDTSDTSGRQLLAACASSVFLRHRRLLTAFRLVAYKTKREQLPRAGRSTSLLFNLIKPLVKPLHGHPFVLKRSRTQSLNRVFVRKIEVPLCFDISQQWQQLFYPWFCVDVQILTPKTITPLSDLLVAVRTSLGFGSVVKHTNQRVTREWQLNWLRRCHIVIRLVQLEHCCICL